MATSTIYSDLQMVVVDIESVPISAPWLGRTTYLLDKSGHTTAVLAQTDQPTVGVSLAPVPYTTQAQAPLPSATAGTLPSGWSYKGCYVDYYPPEHVLALQQPTDAKLSVESCVTSCYQRGYTIAGLENSEQCSCGHALYNGGSLAPRDSDCDLPCTGNAKEVCGASNRLSMYSNKTLAASQPPALQPSRSTTTAPTITPSPKGINSRTTIPTATVAAVVIGVLAGIVIAATLLYCLFRRIRNNRLRTKSLGQASEGTAQAWPPPDRVLSWEEFIKATKEYYVRLDEINMLSRNGNSSGLSLEKTMVGYCPTIPELRERYEQLQCKSQHSFHTDSGAPYIAVEAPTRYSPPPQAPTPLHVGQPTSILKRPALTGVANMAQAIPNNENREASRGIPATRKLGLAKKGVRFGVNQIREFGRSPLIGHGSDG